VQSMVDIEKKHLGIYHLNDEERAAVRRGLREMREGKLASEDEVARAFARYPRMKVPLVIFFRAREAGGQRVFIGAPRTMSRWPGRTQPHGALIVPLMVVSIVLIHR